MKWVRRFARFSLVTVGIIVLTSLGIDATQYFNGSSSALSILTQEALEVGCPEEMQEVSVSGTKLCVDRYESSIGDDCPLRSVSSPADSAANVNQPDCQPLSVKEAIPWSYITYHQAASLCAKSGKRLPTNLEWYTAALGTSDSDKVCNISGQLQQTGVNEKCISGAGVNDMVGNVWEWVEGEVLLGVLEGQTLPPEGYVVSAGSDGVATQTGDQPEITFNDDYFWSDDSKESTLVMRGGFYGSGSDAGVFSVHTAIGSAFAGQAIGFRCVRDF